MAGRQQGRQQAGAPRVLVVWCPDWPVVATDQAGDGAGPVAVVASGRVLACSDAARTAGVRRGQQLRLAQRLCPALQLRDRDPEAETRRFEPVLAAVEAFTPRVEVLRPGLCAIPVKGPARYFGGEDALATQVHAAVAAALAPGRVDGAPGQPEREELRGGDPPGRGPGEEGRRSVPSDAAQFPAPPDRATGAYVQSHVGVADGLFAAVLAARAGVLVPDGRTAEFLAPYPVAALGDEPLAELLTRLGIHTVGAFAVLSGKAVADRFGPTGTAAHRLARGLQSRPLAPRPEGLDLTAEQLFDPPEELAEPLVFVARALAEQLHARLGSVGLTCQRVSVEVTCAEGRTAARLWRHEGRLTASALAERVRWQLQAWQTSGTFTEADGGFTALRLVPDGLVPDQGRQLALWGRAVAEDRVERAVARVQALLGHAGLRRVEPDGGRGPAEQTARIPWGEALPQPSAGGTPMPETPAPWPGRLQEPAPSVVPRTPVPITVLDGAGRPVTVSGRAEVSAPPSRLDLNGRSLPVAGWTGPWPAVEYWWDQARARRRARFQVTVADGRALLLTVEGGHWYVEGAYD